jgi:hypothetical protein
MSYQNFNPIDTAPPWGWNPMGTFVSAFNSQQDLKLQRQKLAQDAENHQAQLAMEQAKIAAEAPLRAAQAQYYMNAGQARLDMATKATQAETRRVQSEQGFVDGDDIDFSSIFAPKAPSSATEPSSVDSGIEELRNSSNLKTGSIETPIDERYTFNTEAPSVADDHPLSFAFQPDTPTDKSTELLSSLPEVTPDKIKENSVGYLADNNSMGNIRDVGGINQAQKTSVESQNTPKKDSPFSSLSSSPDTDAELTKNPLVSLKAPEPEKPKELSLGQMVNRMSQIENTIQDQVKGIGTKNPYMEGTLKRRYLNAQNAFFQASNVSPDEYDVMKKDSPDTIDRVHRVMKEGYVSNGQIVPGSQGLSYIDSKKFMAVAAEKNIGLDSNSELTKNIRSLQEIYTAMPDSSEKASLGIHINELSKKLFQDDPATKATAFGIPQAAAYEKSINALQNNIVGGDGKPIVTPDSIQAQLNLVKLAAHETGNIYNFPKKYDPANPEVTRLLKNSSDHPEGTPFFMAGSDKIYYTHKNATSDDIIHSIYGDSVAPVVDPSKLTSAQRFGNLNLGPTPSKKDLDRVNLSTPKAVKSKNPLEDFSAENSSDNAFSGIATGQTFMPRRKAVESNEEAPKKEESAPTRSAVRNPIDDAKRFLELEKLSRQKYLENDPNRKNAIQNLIEALSSGNP